MSHVPMALPILYFFLHFLIMSNFKYHTFISAFNYTPVILKDQSKQATNTILSLIKREELQSMSTTAKMTR